MSEEVNKQEYVQKLITTGLKTSFNEFGKVALGNRPTILAAIASEITGQHFAAFGPPGTGKSDVISNLWRLFEGYGLGENVVLLQATNRMHEGHLFGTVTPGIDGNPVETDGIITDKTRYVAVPEVNRVAPHIWNPLMEMLEKRYFTKLGSSKIIYPKQLTFGFAGNLQADGQATYRMDDAHLSRISQTSYPKNERNNSDYRSKVRNGLFVPNPESMEVVWEEEDVREITQFLKDFRLDPHDDIKADKLEVKAMEILLTKFNYDEGLRLTDQLGKMIKFYYLANKSKWDNLQWLTESVKRDEAGTEPSTQEIDESAEDSTQSSAEELPNKPAEEIITESVGEFALRGVIGSRLANKTSPSRRHGNTPEGLTDEIMDKIKKEVR